jgi:hypothetical protein
MSDGFESIEAFERPEDGSGVEDPDGTRPIEDAAELDADAVAAERGAFSPEGEPRARSVVRFIARSARRIGVTVIGFVVLVVGVLGLVLPIIPGIPLIIVALAILASEYRWARRALERARDRATQAVRKVRRGRSG